MAHNRYRKSSSSSTVNSRFKKFNKHRRCKRLVSDTRHCSTASARINMINAWENIVVHYLSKLKRWCTGALSTHPQHSKAIRPRSRSYTVHKILPRKISNPRIRPITDYRDSNSTKSTIAPYRNMSSIGDSRSPSDYLESKENVKKLVRKYNTATTGTKKRKSKGKKLKGILKQSKHVRKPRVRKSRKSYNNTQQW